MHETLGVPRLASKVGIWRYAELLQVRKPQKRLTFALADGLVRQWVGQGILPFDTYVFNGRPSMMIQYIKLVRTRKHMGLKSAVEKARKRIEIRYAYAPVSVLHGTGNGDEGPSS